MKRTPPAKRFVSALVPQVLWALRGRGLDTTALEARYLGGRDAAGEPRHLVSLRELGDFLEAAARLAGDATLGLSLATNIPRGAFGLLEFGLRSAPSGRVALEQLATLGPVFNPLVRWHVEAQGDGLALHHRAPRRGELGPQGNVFTVARILHSAREMLGADVVPLRTWFAHDAARCSPALAAFLGTQAVAFGRASNGLAFSASVLARVPAQKDPALNQALEAHGRALLLRFGDTDDVYERARAAVLELLPSGSANLAGVARRLHVTPRTLQRRLSDQDVSFAALLTEARRAEAERLLEQTPLPLEAVAAKVGYSDAATFVRAFRGWSGQTPGRFRERFGPPSVA